MPAVTMALGLADTEFDLQFTLHHADEHSVPDIVEFAGFAEEQGFSRLWLNDNLGYRNTPVALAAVASETSLDLGTAILVPYFRNPVDVASALASITELTDGTLTVGIGRGDGRIAGTQVDLRDPLEVLREAPEFYGALLQGETVEFGEYETLASYFNLNPDHQMALQFSPRGPVDFFYGGYGPKGLAIAGHHMDGVLFGGSSIPLLKTGRMDERVQVAQEAAAEVGKQLQLAAEINVSVSEDPERARQFAKRYVAHAVPELEARTGADFEEFGIERENIRKILDAFERGGMVRDIADLVTDEMLSATYIAGDSDTCRTQLMELFEETSLDQFDKIVFGKLGPDHEQTVELLANEVLPEAFD